MSNHRHVPCPICGKHRLFSARYPNALCNSCGYSKELVDSNGNPIKFVNRPISGGIMSVHLENGTWVERDENTCFLHGIECYAQEARLGGVAVQIYTECPYCRVRFISPTERHLGGLCYDCVRSVVDKDGKRVKFNYEKRWEQIGFVSLHYENELCTKKKEHVCFLDGKKCYAYNHHGDIIVRFYEGLEFPVDTSDSEE